MKIIHAYAATLTLVIGLGAAYALADPSPSPATAPDNSGANMRDRQDTELTADQGSNHKSDLEIMANIRQSVIADKSLSTYAHNVKIIAVNGKVTLKGPVRSDDESKTIETKAHEVVGPGNVTNELSVKSAK